MATVTATGATPRDATSLPERVVARLAGAMDGHELSRRGLLARLAVVASALIVNPLQYVLRPTTAYASVCGPASTCDAGWSVFCCTINDGANTCPEGSFVAGWWKVGRSGFCLGEPRYYVDCNRRPESSCRCRCNDGPGCDHRRICCNDFRYGQCNTQIGGVTEVVCRVVTCTPPWRWDPACSRTVRVDEATRDHSAGCLPRKNPTRIQIAYQDLGMVGSPLGQPVSPERGAVRGGRRREYQNGWILFLSGLGAHGVYGAIGQRYEATGLADGPLGYPVDGNEPVAGGPGGRARFERGTIYDHPDTGPRAVRGSHDRTYRRRGGPTGDLGWPTAGTRRGGDGLMTVTRFQRGLLASSETGTVVALTGRLLEAWQQAGGAESGLGYPVAAATTNTGGAPRQRFQHGLITGSSGGGLVVLRGAIAGRYLETGGAGGPWGAAEADQQDLGGGAVARFESVRAYHHPDTGAHALGGQLLAAYLDEGGPTGRLGFPTSDPVETVTGGRRVMFQAGSIATGPGGTRVDTTSSGRPAADLPARQTGGSRRPARDADDLPAR